jgi:hypothetical protein
MAGNPLGSLVLELQLRDAGGFSIVSTDDAFHVTVSVDGAFIRVHFLLNNLQSIQCTLFHCAHIFSSPRIPSDLNHTVGGIGDYLDDPSSVKPIFLVQCNSSRAAETYPRLTQARLRMSPSES